MKQSEKEQHDLDSSQAYIESTIGIPFTSGNRIKVLKNGNEIFPPMLQAIRQAKKSILFETYVYWSGEIADTFAEALSAKAREGVVTRVLLDAHGSAPMSSKLIKRMKQAGVKVRKLHPLGLRFWDFDKRTHRKILVCDQQIGFTGGVGIASEWEGDARDATEWRETHFQIEGRAVLGLSGAFWNNWIDIDGEYIPESIQVGPSSVRGDALALVARSSPATHQSEMELIFESLLTLASKKITLTTPYFNIREKSIQLLRRKAKDGVQIEILLPGDHIDKSFELLVAEECMGPLLEAGIVIRRYQRSMIHSKIIRIDDDITCVGSPNFNQRSRKKDFEVAVIAIDQDLAQTLDHQYEEDIQLSTKLSKGDLKKVTLWRKIGRKIIMLFREQL